MAQRTTYSFTHQDFQRGLSDAEFLLHFQPRLDTQSGTVIGAEALVRWSHPEFGLLYPGSFIPAVEQTDSIMTLGEWVLRAACQKSREWQDAGYQPVIMSVNFAAVQFKNSDVVGLIRRVLNETNLEARWLEIEITETTLMTLDDPMTNSLNALRDLGVHVSIDDFGTGYSSLTYLKKFTVSTLKIDRQFVQDIPSSLNSIAISKAVITLAHSLNLRVVAEGVETPEQLAFLREHDCDEVQGFLFGEAVSADIFARSFLLRT